VGPADAALQAWEKGIKSLYYLRSKSVQRAGFAGGVEADNTAEAAPHRTGREADRLRGMPGLPVICAAVQAVMGWPG
jgi:hypothetical protein